MHAAACKWLGLVRSQCWSFLLYLSCSASM